MKKLIKKDYLDVLKSLILSIFFTIMLIIIFAVVIQFLEFSDKAYIVINLFIRYLSIILSIFISYKSLSNGLIKGLIVGILYSCVMMLIYAIVNGEFSFTVFSIVDIVCLIIIACISSIFKVNIKNAKV